MISEFLDTAVAYAWGMPLVVLLMGGGLYLLFVSRFLPFRGLFRALAITLGRFQHKGDATASGQLSHFQALTNAVSGTVGLGNIGGVAFALTQGGPGAIFWMWITALIGMNTKFFECTLSVMFRGKDYTGEVQGGPMYVIQKALPKSMLPLAYLFAFCGMIGTAPLYNAGELANILHAEFEVSKGLVGIVCALIVIVVFSGGVRSLGRVTDKLVPFMCLFYVSLAMVIIFLNIEKVPGVFSLIFREAFTGHAAVGGAMGLTFAEVMKTGVKRAAFSNEAGVGTAPMAHSNVKTSEPISEGFVAMLGPFIDTIVVCTMTAVVILVSLDMSTYVGQENIKGVLITKEAFILNFPTYGKYFLGFAAVMFSVSSMLGFANYVQKCWNFIFKGLRGFGNRTFIALYAIGIILGTISSATDIINLLDLMFAMMVLPNMIATVILAPKVKAALKDYWQRYP